MKPPRDTISQRELILRYRILIDEAMHIPADRRKTAKVTRAKEKILTLAKENPNSTTSIHVMWNIGKARKEWLTEFLKEHPEWISTSDSKLFPQDSRSVSKTGPAAAETPSSTS